MKDLDWRPIDRRELAALLAEAEQVSSQAVGEATVYRLEKGGRESLAVALLGGAIVVERAAAAPKRRRRLDRERVSPASR